jgi:hypothetical protein
MRVTDRSGGCCTCYRELQDLSYAHAAAIWGVQSLTRHYEGSEVRGRYFHPARPPHYYAFSKGLPPSTATISDAQSTSVAFAHSSATSTTLVVPAGAVSETSNIVYAPDVVDEESHPGGFRLGSMSFDLQVCQGGRCLADYTFASPVTITLHYTDADVLGLIEEELFLYTWNGSAWVDAVTDCGWPLTAYGRYPEENRLVVPLCHFTRFALVGDTYSVYLPLVLKQR